MPLSERFYQICIRAYPKRFRLQHGEELVQWFREHRATAQRRGGLMSRVRFWTTILNDLIKTVPMEHIRVAIEHRPTRGRGRGGESVLETLLHDARLAVRSFARQPWFFLVAVATLAVGVGATTTIFSVIDGVLLAPLPYDEPSRIVEVGKVSQGTDRIFAMSALDVLDLQERNRSFAALAASMVTRLTVLGDGEPQALRGAMVSPEFFAVLGVRPTLGRPFTAAEDAAATPVAVLSHGVWQRRWEGDPALVGETITLGRTSFTVVGIMPPDFHPPEAIGQVDVELWIPLAFVNQEWRSQR